MKVIGLIPARMLSSRFPGKPLAEIEGLPMIIHVLKRASLCKELGSVFVATDSEEISRLVEHHGGKAIMTSTKHQTGTDRIAEAIKGIKYDLAINIQGDEVLLNPDDISRLIRAMRRERSVKFATLVCKARNSGDVTDCKVVLDQDDNIL
ncbi:MAG: NTP transferase domain-containing protein, partial [bacterium]